MLVNEALSVSVPHTHTDRLVHTHTHTIANTHILIPSHPLLPHPTHTIVQPTEVSHRSALLYVCAEPKTHTHIQPALVCVVPHCVLFSFLFQQLPETEILKSDMRMS